MKRWSSSFYLSIQRVFVHMEWTDHHLETLVRWCVYSEVFLFSMVIQPSSYIPLYIYVHVECLSVRPINKKMPIISHVFCTLHLVHMGAFFIS